MYATTTNDIAESDGVGGGGSPPLKGLAAWKSKMVTKEDPLHIHKTLGMLCMMSFIFRLLHIGESDMGFATYPHLTLPTLVLHLLLNLTSLNFQIPPKRITSGYRIWPQYRLHSLVFLVRALLTMLIIYYEDMTQLSLPNYDLNLLLVVATMIAADVVSYCCTSHQYRSNTIRDLDTCRTVQFGFVLAQFYGTAVALFGMRRYTIPMLSVIVIQGNAFLMTIRRKNLASHNTLLAIYGAALIISMGVSVYEFRRESMSCLRIVATCGQLAFLIRTTPIQRLLSSSSSSSFQWLVPYLRILQSKYVAWCTVGLVLRHLRPHLYDYTWIQVYIFHLMTLLAVIGLFYRHCHIPPSPAAMPPVPQPLLIHQRSHSYGVPASSSTAT